MSAKANRPHLIVVGDRDVGYGVAEAGLGCWQKYAGPFSGPDGYKKAAYLADLWNEMSEAQRDLGDKLLAALESFDPFALDAPNLNAWPAPVVRREFAMWLAARCDKR